MDAHYLVTLQSTYTENWTFEKMVRSCEETMF